MSLTKARQLAGYGAFMALLGLVRLLPHRAARPVGASLGGLAGLVDRRRKVALTNLTAAFPELDEETRRRTVRRCYRHFGGMLFDRLSMTRFDAAGICERTTLNGWQHLLDAEAEGRGVLLLTAHFGSWEMVGDPVSIYRGPSYVISRPTDNPYIDRRARWLRQRFGVTLVDRRGAGRQALHALRNGERVGILADQRVRPHEGVEVPFFGRPATTSTLAARLALRFGTPAVPIYGYPEPRGRFRIEVRPAIHPEGSGREAAARLTARYAAATEEEIRRAPELWFWMHDRWRQRPRRRGSTGAGG